MRLLSRKKTLVSVFALLLVISAGAYWSLLNGARSAEAELQALEPRLELALLQMREAIQARAKLQAGWFEKGLLVEDRAERSRLEQLAVLIEKLPLVTDGDFERIDALQTQISDAIARKLAAGAVAKDLAKEIEKSDMTVHRARTAYFEATRRQQELLGTPFLRHLAGALPTAAALFPAERTLLKTK